LLSPLLLRLIRVGVAGRNRPARDGSEDAERG
jgi:hypothetical protein